MLSTSILDLELLSAIDALDSSKFEALYTSLESDGALAEAYCHLSRAPVMSSSHMHINRLQVSLEKVLSLNPNRLTALGIDEPLASRIDIERSQDIGAAAYMMDYQGLIVPSARRDCNNLVLFIERIDLNKKIKLVEFSDVNWPARKEHNQ